jgi:hypothetical protein
MAEGGAFAGVKAAGTYALPQALWFLVDILRQRRGTHTVSAVQVLNESSDHADALIRARDKLGGWSAK